MAWTALPTRKEIESAANEFRDKFAPGARGALPIEQIIEFGMRLEIVPVADLFKRTRCRGYLTACGKKICIDEGLMIEDAEYRWLLTHEAVHAARHQGHLPVAPFSSVEDCRAYHDKFSQELRYAVEWEAREFAGRVLVPRDELAEVFDHAVIAYTPLFRAAFGRKFNSPLRAMVSQTVAEHFGVPCRIADARIRLDHCWRRFSRPRRLLAGLRRAAR